MIIKENTIINLIYGFHIYILYIASDYIKNEIMEKQVSRINIS